MVIGLKRRIRKGLRSKEGNLIRRKGLGTTSEVVQCYRGRLSNIVCGSQDYIFGWLGNTLAFLGEGHGLKI